MKQKFSILYGFFLIVSVFFIFVRCDNTDISSEQEESFIKFFGSWSLDEGRDVKALSDGYIVVGTTTVSLESGKDIVLIKTNKFGNIVWEKTFDHQKGDDAGSKVLLTEDDGFIIVGTITDTLRAKDIYVLKVSKKGEKEWEKQIGGTYNETGNSIARVYDGYVICGSTTEPNGVNPAGKSDIFIAKINDSGNLIWTNSFGGAEDDYGNDLLISSNEILILGTSGSFYEPAQAGSNIILIETNSEGGETDKMTYGGVYSDLGNSIIHANGGGYIIVGSKGVSASNSKPYMIKVQENIRAIDYEVTLGAESSDYGFAYDVVEHWGNYSIAGNKSLTEKNAIYFIETDENGVATTENQYGGYDDQVMYAIDNTLDGGYIMVGKSGQGSNYMICLMKLNKKGTL